MMFLKRIHKQYLSTNTRLKKILLVKNYVRNIAILSKIADLKVSTYFGNLEDIKSYLKTVNF